jgi:hypothetical protein
LNSIRGAVIGFFVFLIAAYFLPVVETSVKGLEIILTISTFLFAIIAGFFISRLNNRYDTVRTTLGEADGEMFAIYQIAIIISPRFAKRISKIIDDYFITAYDFELAKYNQIYKLTNKHYLQLWDELKNLKKAERKNPYEGQFTELLISGEKKRNLTSVLALERVGVGQWAVLMILACIIIFCIFYLKTEEFYSGFLAVLLSTVLVLVLLLIRDLQNLKIGHEELLEESGQEVFEYIGKPRYYHFDQIKKGMSNVPKHIKEFRVGFHAPGSEKLKIKHIKRK